MVRSSFTSPPESVTWRASPNRYEIGPAWIQKTQLARRRAVGRCAPKWELSCSRLPWGSLLGVSRERKAPKIVMDPFAPSAIKDFVQNGVDNHNIAVTGNAPYYPVGFYV